MVKIVKVSDHKAMGALGLPIEEEVRAAVREGEDAVVVLVASLVKVMEGLAARQQAWEDQLAKNSRNRGQPPSSEGFNRPAPKSLRKRSRTKSGRALRYRGCISINTHCCPWNGRPTFWRVCTGTRSRKAQSWKPIRQ